jgi:hypothetical protein
MGGGHALCQSGGIRTRSPINGTAAEPGLRPRGRRDRQLSYRPALKCCIMFYTSLLKIRIFRRTLCLSLNEMTPRITSLHTDRLHINYDRTVLCSSKISAFVYLGDVRFESRPGNPLS